MTTATSSPRTSSSPGATMLGTCRSCKTKLHVDVVVAASREAVRACDGKLVTPRYVSWEITSGALAGTRTRLAPAWNGRWQVSVSCPRCSAPMAVEAVAGRTTKQKCGAKCMGSTSGKCECACGGHNHGRAFAG